MTCVGQLSNPCIFVGFVFALRVSRPPRDTLLSSSQAFLSDDEDARSLQPEVMVTQD